VGSAYNYTDPTGTWIAHSTFAVVDTRFSGPPRIIQMEGNYFADSISDDGRSLYLIENKPNDRPTTSVLRVYDLAIGTLTDLRGDPLPQMNGFRTDPVRIGSAAYSLIRSDTRRLTSCGWISTPAARASCGCRASNTRGEIWMSSGLLSRPAMGGRCMSRIPRRW
jgi:hypothetical protein